MKYTRDKSDDAEGGNRNAVVAHYDYEEVLERIGFGNTQWIVLLISGLMLTTSTAANMSVGIISVASECEFMPSNFDINIMLSSGIAGRFLSTYAWGYISDAIGRRTVLLYGTFMASCLQFILMFATKAWAFNIINFCVGICLGSITAAGYVYLSEFNTAKYRQTEINYAATFIGISVVYHYVTSWIVLSSDWSLHLSGSFYFRPWRLIILFTLLPGLIGGLMLLRLPESPKLLLVQRKDKAALDAIDWICIFNTQRGVASILERNDFLLQPEEMNQKYFLSNRKGFCVALANIWKSSVALLYKPHGVHLCIGVGVAFGLFYSSSSLHSIYAKFLYRPSNEVTGKSLCEIFNTSSRTLKWVIECSSFSQYQSPIASEYFVNNIVMGCAYIFGFIVQGILLPPFGRKNVIIGSLIFAGGINLLLHFVTNATINLVALYLSFVIPNILYPVLFGALIDFVPTHLRGKTIAIASTFGLLGLFLGPPLFSDLVKVQCHTALTISTGAMIVWAILVKYLTIT